MGRCGLYIGPRVLGFYHSFAALLRAVCHPCTLCQSSSPRLDEPSIAGPAPLAHTSSVDHVVAQYHVDPEIGLSTEEAQNRLLLNGPNEIGGHKGINIWKVLLINIFNAMNIILGAAVALSAVAGDTVEAVVVALIIIINTSISFVQEVRAEKTLDALRRMTSPVAHVIRNGNEMEISATEIVTGDIVVLREGDKVPADMRLVEISSIEINEALLTGESSPVRKNLDAIDDELAPLGDRRCMAYKNTVVTIGHALGLVIATGMDTEIGKIAHTLATSNKNKSSTPLRRLLNNMMFILLGCAAVLVLIVFASNKFNLTTEVLLYALALSVAIIPEALPAVMTLTYANGVRRVARAKAVVRSLNALESLGCLSDICSDKTGTLTIGEMTAVAVSTTGVLYDLHKDPKAFASMDEKTMPLALRMLLLNGCICNSASMGVDEHGVRTGKGDPTEVALLLLGELVKFDKEELTDDEHGTHIVEGVMPFDAALKRMSTIARAGPESREIFVKGAVEVVLERCPFIVDATGAVVPLTTELRDSVIKQAETFAEQALRVLGFAYRIDTIASDDKHEFTLDDREAVESNLIFAGLVGMQDPPRPETIAAVRRCKGAGIAVRMVTGDHPSTAAAIATQVGIMTDKSELIVARAFDAMTDEEIDALPELPRVIARCSPDSKVRLIHALHRRGRIVAMTGDGVNDAPAVSSADVGIAMGEGGTDVTKQAADVVLTDDNFATIVTAVAEGRRVIENIGNFTVHLLSGNVSIVLLLVVGLGLVGQPAEKVFPLSALQIMWMNAGTTAVPALLLGLHKSKHSVMHRPPRSAKQAVFSTEAIVDIITFGGITGILSLLAFALVIAIDPAGSFGASGCNETMTPPGCDVVYRARSATFLALCLMLLIHTYNCLSLRGTLFTMENLKIRGIGIGVVVNALVLLPLIYIPYVNTVLFKHAAISWEWGLVLAAGVLFILASELYKMLKRKKFNMTLQDVIDESTSTHLLNQTKSVEMLTV